MRGTRLIGRGDASLGHHVARAVLIVLTVVAPVLVVTARPDAEAATSGGPATLVGVVGGLSEGQPLMSGGSATAFALKLPAGARCSGDSATNGYLVQSYMVPAAVDPAGLTFDSGGPIPSGIGSVFRQPLFDTAGSGFVDRLTDINTGFVSGLPAFWLGVFGEAGPSIVAEGTYNVGIACTLGQASATQVDVFWNLQIAVKHDPADAPAGLTWAVVVPDGATTTTSSTTTSSTTTSSTTTPSTSTSTSSTTTTAPTTPDPRVGDAGTDTKLPATDSQVTISGRDRFTSLRVSVNQTKSLNNQAVSISWTGAAPTSEGPGRFAANYLQLMQCWGDDDGSNPSNPGPPPEQCVWGGVSGIYGGVPGGLYPNNLAITRVISRPSWSNHSTSVGVLDPVSTNVWMPFRSVDGTVVGIHEDPNFNPGIAGGSFWLNPYFNSVTSNEVTAAITSRDGTGIELMEVQTGVESSGLGCGQIRKLPGSDERRVPKCWIVAVPRGLAADENVGTPFATNADQFGVSTSPLAPEVWKNRIAIPIEFNPVDSPCSAADEERRITGSELALAAVASWQPALCRSGDLPPYSFASVSDAVARQQLAAPSIGAAGMAVVSRPLTSTQSTDPVVYAPLTLSSLVIGMNVERNIKVGAPSAERQLSGVRVADLNLTPRLVAKLLTQSYRLQVSIGGSAPPDYTWVTSNPRTLVEDPDFLQFNPEFELLATGERTFGGLVLPPGNSDVAALVWEWVFADPEAAQWLKGTPDQWGMKVNPVYSSAAEANPSGIAFSAAAGFPKADPYCYQAKPYFTGVQINPTSLCGTDWMPYARGFADSARIGRTASMGAKIASNPFALSSTEAWKREGPQFLGRRAMLVVTDSPSAAQYGLQTARLSRAGDTGSDRAFVAADDAGLTRGVAAMTARSSGVLEPDVTADVAGAYPLSILTYAAVRPLTLDATARSEYSAFVDYAAGAGQVPGLNLGQLPRGYVPLTAELRASASAAATKIRDLQPEAEAQPTPTSTENPVVQGATVNPDSSSSGSSGSSGSSASRSTSRTATPTTTATTVSAEVEISVADPATVSSPVTTAAAEKRADRAVTEGVAAGVSRLGLPFVAGLIPLSALLILEITKRPRRALGPGIAGGLMGDDDRNA